MLLLLPSLLCQIHHVRLRSALLPLLYLLQVRVN
jgi:hypothetical protein